MGGLSPDTIILAPAFTTLPMRCPDDVWAMLVSAVDMLDAGLVAVGDDLVWIRRNLGVRHTARIRVDGALVLADGRAYGNPSGATTALGGNHQNGWGAFRRVSDGRTLGDLRTELRARRGH